MRKDNKFSYRQIVKATSIFGGVQVFLIFIKIIRSKFVAILLGPAGMGIVVLLNSTVGIISSLTNFGLGTSAVKHIASDYATGDPKRISIIITVLRRFVWLTGSLGALLVLISAPWLSQAAFGNNDYTTAFRLISVILLFNQISIGQLALLQGMRKIKYLANANITGAVIGSIISIPIYFKWGIKGIIPTIIISSFASMVRSWYFARKIKINSIKVTYKESIAEGKEMMIMGFMISLSGLITLGASYVIRIFISNMEGIEQVGLYAAGFAIINTYVGLIFTAMSTDYYPRLSGVSHNNSLSRDLINQQAEIAILILAPVLSGFMIFIHWIITILYSTKFVPVNDMILWSGMGMFFKATCWTMGFLFLAKGASRLFFLNELIVNIYMLIFNIAGYYYMGLTGLGISFMAGYILYLVQVYFICSKKYEFRFQKDFISIFSKQFLLVATCFLLRKFIPSPYSYFFGVIVIIISIIFSYKELDKRIEIKQIFNTLKKRYATK